MIDYHHPHFTDEETGIERLSNLPQVTYLINGTVEFRLDTQNVHSYSLNIRTLHNHHHWSETEFTR